MAQPFEGLPSTAWPLTKYGASIGGKDLLIYLDDPAAAPPDRARIFVQRSFKGRIAEPQIGGDPRVLVEVTGERSVWRATLPGPITTPVVSLQRDSGSMGQIDLYCTREVAQLPVATGWYSGAELLPRVPDDEAGLGIKSEVSPAELRCAKMTTGPVAKTWGVSSPAFEGFQMLTEPLAEATPLDGVVVKLVAKALPAPAPVTVVVKEPAWPQRDWCVADLMMTQPSVTLVLRPRPVVARANGSLSIEVVTGAPVDWLMGEGGCGLGLLKGDRDKIMPKHVADQLDFLREAFAETNEGHVFDYMAAQRGMWARLSRPAEALDELVPDNPTLMQLKRRLGWDKTPVVYPDPPNPGGAPEWALWQRECMIGAQRILHWLIDNRQVSNGEFGGVWGDDTDLVESWMGVWLASDDDDKIKNALRLLADGVWEYCLVEGVSASIRDALRSQGTARRRRGNHGIHGTHGRGRRGDGAVEASPPAPLLKGEGRTATAATPGPPRARPAGGTPCGPRYRQQPRRVCSPIDALMPCQP